MSETLLLYDAAVERFGPEVVRSVCGDGDGCFTKLVPLEALPRVGEGLPSSVEGEERELVSNMVGMIESDDDGPRAEAIRAFAGAYPRRRVGEACALVEAACESIDMCQPPITPPYRVSDDMTIGALSSDDEFAERALAAFKKTGEARLEAVLELFETYCEATERTAYEAVCTHGALTDPRSKANALFEPPRRAAETGETIVKGVSFRKCSYIINKADDDDYDDDIECHGLEVRWSPPPRLTVEGGRLVFRRRGEEVIALAADERGAVRGGVRDGESWVRERGAALEALEHAIRCELPPPPTGASNVQRNAKSTIVRRSVTETVCHWRAAEEDAPEGARWVAALVEAQTHSNVIDSVYVLSTDESGACAYRLLDGPGDAPSVRETQEVVSCVCERLRNTAACVYAHDLSCERLREAMRREGGRPYGDESVIILLQS